MMVERDKIQKKLKCIHLLSFYLIICLTYQNSKKLCFGTQFLKWQGHWGVSRVDLKETNSKNEIKYSIKNFDPIKSFYNVFFLKKTEL